jgi:pimeloyl-ACP methyl ester carboxylesterase
LSQASEWYEGGQGSTLVLLHGFGGTWRSWKPILPMLEKHHHVVAPTLPGHIGGIKLKKRASPVSISEAVAEQLQDRGIYNAHFVGQSLGGWAVFEMARFGLARSALGLSPAGAFSDRDEVIAFMRKGRSMLKVLPIIAPFLKLAVRSPALRKRVLAGEMQHADRMTVAEARNHFDRLLRMTIVKEYLDETLDPIKPLPADCSIPLRVAWGACDTTLPFDKFGQPLLDLLDLSSYITLEDCGHNPVWDDPQGVVKTILDFTREVENNEELLSASCQRA